MHKYLFAALLGLLCPASPVVAAADYKFEETKNLVKFVNRAAALIAEKGEDAFPSFREPSSNWYHEDIYVFVWDMDGNRVVYPADRDAERINLAALKDLDGKPLGELFLQAAKAGGGWVHYYWPQPGQKSARWKSAYITAAKSPVTGIDYLVGSGMYNMAMEPAFIEDTVNKASELLIEKGTAAFSAFNDPAGPFMYAETYVFVINDKGIEVVDPPSPEYVGKDILGLTDSDGRFMVKDILEKATEKGRWSKYTWPRPGSMKPSLKDTYVRKVTAGGQVYFVGSGIYMPDVYNK